MAPHYERPQDPATGAGPAISPLGGGPEDEAIDEAADALRDVEVAAAQPDIPDLSSLDASKLESMNIDELRVVAKELDVPDRATITEKDELVDAIRRCL